MEVVKPRLFLGSLVLAGLVSGAAAQTLADIKPRGTFQVKPGAPLNTATLLPQVNAKFTPTPREPVNELVFKWAKPVANNPLRAGGLIDAPRINNIEAKFPGIGATGWVPPDPDLGVGPQWIVAVVNSSVGFFNKSTGQASFLQTSETFFSGLGATSFQFDPKALYDPMSRRFFIIFCEFDSAGSQSKMLLAVSDDDNPNGTWYRYRIETKLTVGSDSFWLDYPGFGVSQNHLAFCGNMFGFTSGWAGNQFIVLPKAPLLTGQAVTATSLHDPSSASVKIAAVSQTPNLYAVSVVGSGQLRVQSVTNTAVVSRTVLVPPMNPPQTDVPGPGGHNLDALDGRLYNAQWRNGTLVTTHGITVGNDPRQVSRWYDINLNGFPTSGNNPTLIQAGNIGGGTGEHFHMPAIGKNRRGDIAVIFSRTSPNIQADLMLAARRSNDPIGSMGRIRREATTIGRYGGVGTNRWGDYFGVAIDPVDDSTFWAIGMVGVAGGNWGTQIFSFRVTNYDDLAVLAPVTAAAPLPNQGTVAGGVPSNLNLVDGRTMDINSRFVSGLGHVASIRTEYTTPLTSATTGLLRLNLNGTIPSDASWFVYFWNPTTNAYELIQTFAGSNTSAAAERVEAAAARYVGANGKVIALVRMVRPIRPTSAPFTARVDRFALFQAPRL